MKKLLIGAAALAVVTPAIAQVAAQSPAPAPQVQRAPKAMKVHTRADVQAKIAEHFARLDANRDGFVTKAEADAARAQFASRVRERSGERREKAFDRLDANNDGAVSKSEWDARSAERAQRVAARGDREGRRGHRFGRGMHSLSGHMFEMADANRDGRVSLPEAQTAALQHFDMMDANRDGQITREERVQMRQRMRAQHQRG
jgi:Ca2+-binding EF-hand superfamily protein